MNLFSTAWRLGLLLSIFSTVQAQTNEIMHGLQTTTSQVILENLDLKTGKLSDQVALDLTSVARFKSFLTLPDGTVILSQTNVGKITANHLLLVNSYRRSVPILGLGSKDTLESIVSNQGMLLGLVAQREIPPFHLVKINPQTGLAQSLVGWQLPKDDYLGTLTRCGDGTIYGTSLQREGFTHLVQFDLNTRQILPLVRLQWANKPLSHNVRSLACARDRQLYVTADPDFSGHNHVFQVNAETGDLTPFADITYDHINF